MIGLGTNTGYSLGDYPVPHGAGTCQRGSCQRDADRAMVMMIPYSGHATALRIELVILWVCKSCSAAAQETIDGKKKAAA